MLAPMALLRPSELARLWELHPKTVYLWIREGKLPALPHAGRAVPRSYRRRARVLREEQPASPAPRGHEPGRDRRRDRQAGRVAARAREGVQGARDVVRRVGEHPRGPARRRGRGARRPRDRRAVRRGEARRRRARAPPDGEDTRTSPSSSTTPKRRSPRRSRSSASPRSSRAARARKRSQAVVDLLDGDVGAPSSCREASLTAESSREAQDDPIEDQVGELFLRTGRRTVRRAVPRRFDERDAVLAASERLVRRVRDDEVDLLRGELPLRVARAPSSSSPVSSANATSTGPLPVRARRNLGDEIGVPREANRRGARRCPS